MSLHINHNKELVQSYVLPKLILSECVKNCVGSDLVAAENKQQATCISNCQAKTYQSFNIMMEVQASMKKHARTHDLVDLSAYTGMEIEHGHDTAN